MTNGKTEGSDWIWNPSSYAGKTNINDKFPQEWLVE
jgi:hypothetical protein